MPRPSPSIVAPRSRATFVVLCTCLALASAACFQAAPRIPADADAPPGGAETVAEDEDPSQAPEADDAEARLRRAACDKIAACPQYGHVDVARCEGPPMCDLGPTLHIPEEALAACLSAMERASCDTYFSTDALPECEGVQRASFVPSGKFVELGSACSRDGMCPEDAYCNLSELSCGECVKSKEPGDACVDGAECLSGRCEAGECADLRANGEECTRAAQCVGGACNQRTCARALLVPAQVGEPCSGANSCLRCENGVCLGMLACVDGSCAHAPAIGEHCSDECGHDATCESSVCVALPGPGEACSSACRTPSRCVEGECTASICAGGLSPGDRCDKLTHCGEGLACDLAQLRCIALPGVGDYCSAFRCWRSYCDAATDTCHDLLREGAACEEHEQCQSALCGTRGKCEKRPWCADAIAPR
jgi:hypothetical protein